MPRAHGKSQPKRSATRYCLSGCIYVACGMAVLTAYLLKAPEAPPEPTAAEIASSTRKMQSLRLEIEAVKADARRGTPHSFSASLTEQEINAYLIGNDEIRRLIQRNRIDKAYVRIEDGRLRVTGVRQLGIEVAVTATLLPSVGPGGKPRLDVEDVKVGRVGLPIAEYERTARKLAKSIAERFFDPGVKYHSIRVTGHLIEVAGDTR